MYAKVFSQIYDGTLCTCGKWQALVTFQQLLVLADKNGIVDMTIAAIARRTTIPIEIIQEGIGELLKADPESRTPTEEGRRIIPLSNERNWGWEIVNYKHYRNLRSEEERTEYHRNYYHNTRKSKLKNVEKVEIQQLNTNSNDYTYAEAEAEAEANNISFTNVKDSELFVKKQKRKPDETPYEEILRLYGEILPEMQQQYSWTDKRKAQVRALWEDKGELPELADWEKYFKFIRSSKFLMGKVPPINGHKQFKGSLEWITNRTNYINITERKYHGE
jgi:hypothetical protein